MNSEHDFDQLRQLLALKRHEQPPPGFFNSFSYQVIARIKAGEIAEESTFIERLFGEAPWIQSLWNAFEAKPIVAGSMSFAICGLLAAGVFYTDAPTTPNVATAPTIFHAELVPTVGRVNPVRPLLIEEPTVPADLRSNPLLLDRGSVQEAVWTP